MKNKNLLLLGAIALGGVLWYRHKNKAERTASLEADAEMSACSGCSNASGEDETVYYTAEACMNIQNNLGINCQTHCENGGGIWSAGDPEIGSSYVGACSPRTTRRPRRGMSSVQSLFSADGNGGW